MIEVKNEDGDILIDMVGDPPALAVELGLLVKSVSAALLGMTDNPVQAVQLSTLLMNMTRTGISEALSDYQAKQCD